MSLDSFSYKLDVVCCIEATMPMQQYSAWITEFLRRYLVEIVEAGREAGYISLDGEGIGRVKFILFRDMNCCPVPFEMSEFYDFHSMEAIQAYIDSIEYKGGYGYCNLYEAIVLAITSEWRNESRTRHMILAFSDSKAREIGTNEKIFSRYSPCYIPDIPTLSALWEGTCSEELKSQVGSNYINGYHWNFKSLCYFTYDKNTAEYAFAAWNGAWGEDNQLGVPENLNTTLEYMVDFPWGSW